MLAAEVVVVAVLGWFRRWSERRIGCWRSVVFIAVGCRLLVGLSDGGYSRVCGLISIGTLDISVAHGSGIDAMHA